MSRTEQSGRSSAADADPSRHRRHCFRARLIWIRASFQYAETCSLAYTWKYLAYFGCNWNASIGLSLDEYLTDVKTRAAVEKSARDSWLGYKQSRQRRPCCRPDDTPRVIHVDHLNGCKFLKCASLGSFHSGLIGFEQLNTRARHLGSVDCGKFCCAVRVKRQFASMMDDPHAGISLSVQEDVSPKHAATKECHMSDRPS